MPLPWRPSPSSPVYCIFSPTASSRYSMERWREVLDFWFGPGAGPQLWFGGAPATDREIRGRFSGLLADAVAGKLAGWEDSPGSTVALVVVLDQFSLQLHR